MDMQERFIRAAQASVSDIFNTMVPLELEMCGNGSQDKPELIPHDIIGIIGLAGNVTGTISLFLSNALAMKIASLLLEEDIGELCDDVYESVGELTNMVAGGIKTALSTHWDLFELSLPTVISGTNTQAYYVPPSSHHWQLPVRTDHGAFLVAIAISSLSEAAAQA